MVLSIFLGIGCTFLLRSPVLIVTDSSFAQLYGPLRFRIKGIKNNIELFRRVIPVPVTESAGPSLVALTVEEVHKAPGAVMFPFRYLEGARSYKENHPEVMVFVMGGRSMKPADDTTLTFVGSDSIQDLYRAGLFAALLAGEKRVLIFSDGNLGTDYSEAFLEGLRAQGFLGYPVYVNASLDYSSYSDIGCVVVAGPAIKFLERNLKIPVILFSWVDPGQVPKAIKLLFDDSPWTLAVSAFKLSMKQGTDVLVPSEAVILLDKEERKNFRNIDELIKGKFEKN